MPVLDPPSWSPSVQDVANFLIARTRLPNGSLAGTFTDATTPTVASVQAIIAQQVSLLAPRLGDVPDALADSAGALLALKAAIEVEQSYFMEQISSDASPHREMCAQFPLALKAYLEAAEGDVPNGYRTYSVPVGTLYPGYATGTY
jgi:hypothetical protein